jgi:hypothetical protein
MELPRGLFFDHVSGAFRRRALVRLGSVFWICASPLAALGQPPAPAASRAAEAPPTLAAPRARPPAAPGGAKRVSAPPGQGQGAVGVELAADGLWLRACPAADCAGRGGQRLALPDAALAHLDKASLEVVELAPGRRVIHVAVPLADGAWEALVAAAPGKTEPLVIFAGNTGAIEGEEGERQGDVLWIRAEDGQKKPRVLVGRVREDMLLCGRPTIVEPRLLGADLTLRPAKVQQLALSERRAARVLGAVRAEAAPAPGGNVLRALAASSALGDPSALTDGRDETSWAEARGGDGRGEFVVLRALSGAALVGLDFLIRHQGAVPAAGVAPRSVWLATRSAVFRIDWSEDAWKAPGVWYRVRFPEPVNEDCLALVLEQSFSERADAMLTIAEIRGVSELSSLTPAELVGRLSTPGDVGAAAVPALLQAGPVGIAAVINAFGALDGLGRARALDIIEGAPCEIGAPVYAELLTDTDSRTERRAQQRLRVCGPQAYAALRRAFERSSGEAAGVGGGVEFARSLAAVAPALAVELIGARLAAVPAEQRASYRDALSRAAVHPDAEPSLRRLLVANGLGVAVETEVLRALGDELPKYQPDASRVFAKAAAAARTFEQRYVLLQPAARLAASDPIATAFFQQALGDADPYLRTAAVRAAPDVPALRPALIASLRDPEVRVREGSALRLAELRDARAAGGLIERLEGDSWPLVRAAAARALAESPPSTPVDSALARALDDHSAVVRALSVRALGRRGARQHLAAIRERFSSVEEDAAVRASSASALGDLCDTVMLDELTRATRQLLADRPSPDDVSIASAALLSLGQLAPADLEARLLPLAKVKGQPLLEDLLRMARQPARRCAAPAAASVPTSRAASH